ncbi:GTPase ObgE [Candidatus Kaiserbacteria bacterium CG10_big_fil_rev_8_21_14_0_10_44_10]|uniref:GTPase Obg n=1 Tax=Candidatus Kaiserbacteria bacterium CG10_big_fil_rev_8_21_14_0_10_44_10 TaxID=1974606 RepID=A0A2H0UI34_9BACT|nr:MAG: GTPase ObgE [Candidatus Kaiserbacteria bacterium CG10_big_fil_rev_8_21_14_0_10_44_10]
MFVDEITIKAKAGDGGDGVARWRQEKFKPHGGPAGGNGGRGGSVYVRAVRDLSLLSKYTGSKVFKAEDGEQGRSLSQHGHASEDLYIDVPVGSRITDLGRGRTVELEQEGQTEKILEGGRGGLGNEHFKSSVNRSPLETTKGKKGEEGDFLIELALVVDVGLIGKPNAGKSTLLNAMTNARSAIGDYPFTTLEPHLGDMYGFVLADIPGLIEGASEGKGLGHKFLKHISKTKMLLHLVSLEEEDPKEAYYTILKELSAYDKTIADKETWIVFTKKDLVSQHKIDEVLDGIDIPENRVFVISTFDPESVKLLQDSLTKNLRNK